MKHLFVVCAAACGLLLAGETLAAQSLNVTQTANVNKQNITARKNESRQEIVIPNVNGYQVLKCDFHIHTVFSDGSVWPDFRVQEAWRDGMDAIAMTDHIEYLPYKKYFNADFNTSYEIAKPVADRYGLILIRGTEITRKQGEIGHFNALFIKDANTIPADDPEQAIRNALAQDAFILFNHPGWAVDTCKITPFQQKMMDQKMIHGIEVFNHLEFYPRAISWCTDLGYPMFANSDEHGIISEDFEMYGPAAAFLRHRPITLVLASACTQEAIREALFAKRTIAYSDNTFAGEAQLLADLFQACVSKTLVSKGEKTSVYNLTNHSSLRFDVRVGKGGKLTLGPQSTIRITLANDKENTLTLLNMWSREDQQVKVVW